MPPADCAAHLLTLDPEVRAGCTGTAFLVHGLLTSVACPTGPLHELVPSPTTQMGLNSLKFAFLSCCRRLSPRSRTSGHRRAVPLSRLFQHRRGHATAAPLRYLGSLAPRLGPCLLATLRPRRSSHPQPLQDRLGMLSALDDSTTAAALVAMPAQERMDALEHLSVRDAAAALQAMHPADRLAALGGLQLKRAALVVLAMEPGDCALNLSGLHPQRAAEMIRELPESERASVMDRLPNRKAASIAAYLSPKERAVRVPPRGARPPTPRARRLVLPAHSIHSRIP